jgi:exopolysaccharide biosynthesis polyprenyl glycosylphosphotransferase
MSSPAPFHPESSQPPASLRLHPAGELQSLGLENSAATLHSFEALARQRPAARWAGRVQGRNVLIVGAGPVGRELATVIELERNAERNVIGFLDETEAVSGDVLGRIENLDRIARAEFVDEIFLAIPNQHELALRVIRAARRNRLDVRAIPDLYGYGWDSYGGPERTRLGLEYFGDLPILTLHEETVTPGLFWKRVLDIMMSVIGLCATFPLMAAIALLIKLTSPGQILYRAERVGLKGRRFVCYKFRTMVSDADQMKEVLRAENERQGPCFKLARDPRVTSVGRLLRRYSLDELPQLWNVLRGEMSMVGPRPHPLDDFQRYRLEHLRRLDVTPGITGLWQVTARRDPSFQRNMMLDLEYIENWSIRMDLRILWKTVFVVLHGSGS